MTKLPATAHIPMTLCQPQPDASTLVTTILHEFAESLGTAVDAKDSHTARHSEEVAQVSHTIALAMGLSARDADLIHVAGHLHDIGKIGVPDEVLFKRTKLTKNEWMLIKMHPEIGAQIVNPVRSLVETGIRDIILHHHERYDGKGYPHGLKGREIPLGARIVTVADSLSAMLQNRPYREAMTFDEARKEVVNECGKQFDPLVVGSFIRAENKIRCVFDMLKMSEYGD